MLFVTLRLNIHVTTRLFCKVVLMVKYGRVCLLCIVYKLFTSVFVYVLNVCVFNFFFSSKDLLSCNSSHCYKTEVLLICNLFLYQLFCFNLIFTKLKYKTILKKHFLI